MTPRFDGLEGQPATPRGQHRYLTGLLTITSLVLLLDFVSYVNSLSEPQYLLALGSTIGMNLPATYQRAFFLAFFTGVLGTTSAWLALRLFTRKALSNGATVEETRTALAYTTVGLFAYALFNASQAAFFQGSDAFLYLAAAYSIAATLIVYWTR